jgi:GNAT superfamily N-acetyltransferase
MKKFNYFKRYRMEVDLRQQPPGIAGPTLPGLMAPVLSAGFRWIPWHGSLRDIHGEVKALCFRDEMDAVVFPCLGSLCGCRDLMAAIVGKPGFCPAATWLVADEMAAAGSDAPGGCVATIQGVVDDDGHGSIQNVGVIPEYRGQGIGRGLILKALGGFAGVGVRRVYLEVTARNEPAVRMYRELGFRATRTTYRAVPIQETAMVGL